jgi:Ca2+-binding RTX toxin-like protein
VDSAGDKINDLGAATDVDTVLVLQTINYTLPANVENAAINASGNANLTGNTLNNGLTGNADRNILDGGLGNDKLDGGAGADSLLGGVGNDAMIGGAGNDTMRGGEGVDLADFAAAGVDISIDLATGRAKGDGTDLLFDIENILAGEGDDTLTGSAGANDLDGGAGIDALNGGAGNDTLAGCFFGANGGRSEIDTLVGGVGNDIFQLGYSSGRFYDVRSANDLPQIFIKETAVILKSAIYEEPFKPQVKSSSEVIRGIAAAEDALRAGPVYLLKRNQPDMAGPSCL